MAGSPFDPRPEGDVTARQKLTSAVRARGERDMLVIYAATAHALKADFPNRSDEYDAALARLTLSTDQQSKVTALLSAAQVEA